MGRQKRIDHGARINFRPVPVKSFEFSDEGRKETFKRITPLSAEVPVKSIAEYGRDSIF